MCHDPPRRISVLKLDGVSKRFGAIEALRDVSLTVERGRTTVLIGESGSGKSTVLRLIAGLAYPDTGTLTVDGNQVEPATIQALRRRIGYVIQEGGLFPHLRAGENVALMARYLGWDEQRITARVAELLSLVRLPEDTLARRPRALSGGQRQRVALMRALMLDPELLLLDEPLGALDPITRSDLQTDLRAIFAQLQKTVVMVTHDLGEAGFFGDAIALMRDGAIVQQGTLQALLSQPSDAYVTRFIHAQRDPLSAPELAGR